MRNRLGLICTFRCGGVGSNPGHATISNCCFRQSPEPSSAFRKQRSHVRIASGASRSTAKAASLKNRLSWDASATPHLSPARFDTGQGHHGKNINGINNLSRWFDSSFHGKIPRCIENARKNSPQPSGLLAFLLVSGEQTFAANSLFPNDGIEQMARKNDGASANLNTSTARVPVMGLRA